MTLAFTDQRAEESGGQTGADAGEAKLLLLSDGQADTGAATDNQDAEFAAATSQRISVRAPYFALEGLAPMGSDKVIARVAVARPVHPESGLASAAQVSRHLAILGSCAVAMQRDDNDRMHYLATKAHFLRTASVEPDHEQVSPTESSTLVAHATGIWVDRRNARALVRLMDPSGQTMNVLEVEYTVMTPRMFDRLHPPADNTDSNDADRRLGAGQPDDGLPFEISHCPDGVEVDCGMIPEAMCAGHFPGYPAAPVALVMGQLARAAGKALIEQLRHGELTYQVNEARVVASKLGRAGQQLRLRATYARQVGLGHLLICSAQADGNTVGEMELTLMPTSAPQPRPFPIGAI